MIRDRLLGERIQCARMSITLELVIPRVGVELGEPTTQFEEFSGRERSDLVPGLLDIGHTFTITKVRGSADAKSSTARGSRKE
jgi:hypothetical protein